MREEIEAQGGIKLIYIDPPFDVGVDFTMDVEVGDETLSKKPNVLEEIAYRDTWGRGANSFLAMIYERLNLMRDLMAEDGRIFVHCGWKTSGLIRLVLDEVFGQRNFINEIVWYYYNKMQGNVGRFASNHDTIFWYRKGDGHCFKAQKEKRAEPVKQLKRVWNKETKKLVNAKDENGRVIYITTDERTVDDVWCLSMLQPADKTKNLRYPTQKPETLVSRIIDAASEPGDLVADFFIGFGTTAAVAEKLGRKWIASDLGKFAIHTTRRRMIGVQRELKASGENYRVFEILNLGKYERQYYVGVNPGLRGEAREHMLQERAKAFRDLILRAYRAEPVTGFENFSANKSGRLVAIGPVNLPVGRLFVDNIIHECRQNRITKVDLLGFEFEMGLFPNALEEARKKGIDISPRHILREVFDKRAVEAGEVRFHDVAHIDFKTHVSGGKLAVELSDFAVSYSQDADESALDKLRKKGSKIIVKHGQVFKVSRDKEGKLEEEQLTKSWTDWIDYWSVDFDWESKQEIIRHTDADGNHEDVWSGDYVFENEWQSFRMRKDRSLDLKSATVEVEPGQRKV
ncbi:MAG: site-specific DNA-methyltransferase [Litorimonas sp.]